MTNDVTYARCPTCGYRMSDQMGWRQTDGRIVVKVHCRNPEGFHDFLIPFPEDGVSTTELRDALELAINFIGVTQQADRIRICEHLRAIAEELRKEGK